VDAFDDLRSIEVTPRSRHAKLLSKAVIIEPDFVMLLAEPEVRLLMRADKVDEAELLTMLTSVSVHVRDEPRGRRGPGYRVPHPDIRKYRTGARIMLINHRSEIFIARRNNAPDAWQMPQGGIDAGETPSQAAYGNYERILELPTRQSSPKVPTGSTTTYPIGWRRRLGAVGGRDSGKSGLRCCSRVTIPK
jgi:NUDIX domain